MNPTLFGLEHLLYIFISTLVGTLSVLITFKYVKKEKTKNIILKVVAGLLFIAIMTNRLSQVFRYDTVRWYCIIPDSYCGMTSLVLSLAVLFGKKNNCVLHFVWLLGLFGGISTVIYATFVGQSSSIFYLPTISGLVHHSFSALLVVLLLMFKQIDITYKKWYCTLFGFTCYLTVGAFLVNVFGYNDAFHMKDPLLSGTPLTAWFLAPIYAVLYGIVLYAFYIIDKKKSNIQNKNTNNKI